jgi:hypothetical protein
MPLIIGLDLGTAALGVVIARNTLPLYVTDATTINVTADLGALADEIRALADRLARAPLPPDIICELGPLYIPVGASPQKARAVAANHATMERLLDRICQACPGPWYRVTPIARHTWASRVVPHQSGGVSTAQARTALPANLDPHGRWLLLADQHTRDAAGALIGHLLGPAPKARPRRRSTSPGLSLAALSRRAHDAAADALLVAAQARAALLPQLPYSGRR